MAKQDKQTGMSDLHKDDALFETLGKQKKAKKGKIIRTVIIIVVILAVVLIAGVSKAGQMLLEGVEASFHKYVFHAASGARFALASLFNDAGAYGAFKLALDAFGN